MGRPRAVVTVAVAVVVIAAEAEAAARATEDEGAPSRPPETTATATQTPRTNAAEDEERGRGRGRGRGCWRTTQRPPGYLYASAGGQTHHAPRTPPRTVFVSVFGPQHARASLVLERRAGACVVTYPRTRTRPCLLLGRLTVRLRLRIYFGCERTTRDVIPRSVRRHKHKRR